jgi:hypothetical protein
MGSSSRRIRTRAGGRAESGAAGRCRTRSPIGRWRKRPNRNSSVACRTGMVQGVEELRAEPQPPAVLDEERPGNGNVEVGDPGSRHDIAAGAAESSDSGGGECAGIEPARGVPHLIGGAASLRQGLAACGSGMVSDQTEPHGIGAAKDKTMPRRGTPSKANAEAKLLRSGL